MKRGIKNSILNTVFVCLILSIITPQLAPATQNPINEAGFFSRAGKFIGKTTFDIGRLLFQKKTLQAGEKLGYKIPETVLLPNDNIDQAVPITCRELCIRLCKQGVNNFTQNWLKRKFGNSLTLSLNDLDDTLSLNEHISAVKEHIANLIHDNQVNIVLHHNYNDLALDTIINYFNTNLDIYLESEAFRKYVNIGLKYHQNRKKVMIVNMGGAGGLFCTDYLLRLLGSARINYFHSHQNFKTALKNGFTLTNFFPSFLSLTKLTDKLIPNNLTSIKALQWMGAYNLKPWHLTKIAKIMKLIISLTILNKISGEPEKNSKAMIHLAALTSLISALMIKDKIGGCLTEKYLSPALTCSLAAQNILSGDFAKLIV